MILKETILSAFTERGTLLKWLKKVEAALNNAVLTDISVVQVSATQVKLKLTFENGDFVESPVITLPRGEKGEKGEAGKDGLDGQGIAATVEVGTVTTGAAGTDASVTNVGTEQRAVLNFVIPRGDTGATGAEGSAGVGFDDADEISINDGAVSITAGDNGVNIEASFEVAVGEEILEIPSTMCLPLKGSESIVIDVDESGEFIDIHLDADIAAKLGRVLLTPMSAPASVSLVAVDTSNAQTMLTLGDGLSVENGVLSASGGGSGGSGTSLYLHTMNFSSGTPSSIIAINTKSNPALIYYDNREGQVEINESANHSFIVSNIGNLVAGKTWVVIKIENARSSSIATFTLLNSYTWEVKQFEIDMANISMTDTVTPL